jgi:uncharacterized protein
MEWYIILALLGTGLVAGFINTTAGGGSMLSLPLLMFLDFRPMWPMVPTGLPFCFKILLVLSTFRQKKVLDLTTDYRLVFLLYRVSCRCFVAVEINVVVA